jgi:glycosyltransferase involved in cell wall biosynthesis
MMWYKGIRMILDGLVRVKKRGADFRMVFVGSGGEFDEIQACAETLGLADRCVFVGAVNDREALRAYFCRADLFLFPSSYDTNGIVVHEAAACGLASALLRGSAAAEDVTDGVNGLLIDENADSLAETLLRVTADLPFARALGERAAGTLYIPWEDAVKKACERYRVIVERHKGSPRKPTRILSGRQPRAADLK